MKSRSTMKHGASVHIWAAFSSMIDNDLKHKSKQIEWMENNMKKNMFEWPIQSQDLNPIESFPVIQHRLEKGPSYERFDR